MVGSNKAVIYCALLLLEIALLAYGERGSGVEVQAEGLGFPHLLHPRNGSYLHACYINPPLL